MPSAPIHATVSLMLLSEEGQYDTYDAAGSGWNVSSGPNGDGLALILHLKLYLTAGMCKWTLFNPRFFSSKLLQQWQEAQVAENEKIWKWTIFWHSHWNLKLFRITYEPPHISKSAELWRCLITLARYKELQPSFGVIPCFGLMHSALCWSRQQHSCMLNQIYGYKSLSARRKSPKASSRTEQFAIGSAWGVNQRRGRL